MSKAEQEERDRVVKVQALVCEKLAKVRAILTEIIEDDLEGVIDPVLCVGEGYICAAKVAIEHAEELF